MDGRMREADLEDNINDHATADDASYSMREHDDGDDVGALAARAGALAVELREADAADATIADASIADVATAAAATQAPASTVVALRARAAGAAAAAADAATAAAAERRTRRREPRRMRCSWCGSRHGCRRAEWARGVCVCTPERGRRGSRRCWSPSATRESAASRAARADSTFKPTGAGDDAQRRQRSGCYGGAATAATAHGRSGGRGRAPSSSSSCGGVGSVSRRRLFRGSYRHSCSDTAR